jgi:DNA-binding response OmpR family regulator
MKKILIIEDEEVLSGLLRKKIEKEGFEAYTAPDGEEGLKMMREIMPDLILLDILMPKKGGFEVMEEMSRDDAIKNIPVIIFSNSGQPVELDRAKALGAKDCLVKTEFDPQEVLDKVIEQIGK